MGQRHHVGVLQLRDIVDDYSSRTDGPARVLADLLEELRGLCADIEVDVHTDTVDPVAVAECIRGRVPADRLLIQERAEVVRQLRAQDRNDLEIADLTGMTARTAQRIRQRLGLPPAPRGEEAIVA